jgi:hypothetical protein
MTTEVPAGVESPFDLPGQAPGQSPNGPIFVHGSQNPTLANIPKGKPKGHTAGKPPPGYYRLANGRMAQEGVAVCAACNTHQSADNSTGTCEGCGRTIFIQPISF